MKKLLPIHKFLLRTNGLVGIDRIAAFLGESETSVRQRLNDLGLPEIDVLEMERAFPVIMRRIHDILSEDDTAKLLDMPVDEIRKIALDMDFLDVKLGKKPDCIPPIDVNAPGASEVNAAFYDFSKSYFDDFQSWEDPFSFLKQFTNIEPDTYARPEGAVNSCLETRMMYSYTGTHGDFLLSGEDFYSEGILSRLRNRGVNGGWMPVLLRDMAPSNIFPEFGEGYEVRLENLRKQVEKAARYGIKIYLYFNEPRFMPEAFFEKYPDSKGMPASQPGFYGMCTSDPSVRQWMRDATEFVFRAVPGIGGVVLITASENETNCYSHIGYAPEAIDDGLDTMKTDTHTCPRCRPRGPQQVLGDAANLVLEGIEAAGSDAQVMQWLWGWDGIAGRENMEAALGYMHPKVIAMVDWAKNTEFTLFGKEGVIGEYTLAYVRPSKFAQEMIEIARKQGRKAFSRNPLVTTVEMNALPYLPVLSNVEILLNELQDKKMNGLLGCWIFGAYPGRSMEMFNYLDHDHPTVPLAEKYYGKGADEALAAWKSFSDGMAYYPTLVSILYASAINPGPGLRFPLEPELWRWGMVAMATEQIEAMSQPFGADVTIKGFKKVAEYFAKGLVHLQKAIELSDKAEWKQENLRDYGICEACLHHLQSAANYSEFILARNKWLEDKDNINLQQAVITILKSELENSKGMFEIAKGDSRMGFEGSIGYFYTPMEIVEKIYDLQCSIEELAG